MGFKERIKRAYGAIIGRNDAVSAENAELTEKSGLILSSELDDIAETSPEMSLIDSLGPELREFIAQNAAKDAKNASGALLPPRVVPVHLLTDTPTAAQILTLLGIVRWCMEKSSENGESFEINLTIQNRGKSPFLVELGDKSIPAVPPPKVGENERYEIGS